MDYKQHLNEIKSFIDDKEQNDQLTFILISHLLCEKYINEIIESMLPSGKHLTSFDKSKFSLIDKVNVLKATGKFPPITYLMILELNKLRNKFSHQFRYQITENDLNKIGIHMGRKKLDLIMSRNWTNSEKIKPIIYFIFGNLVKISEFKEKIKLK